MSSTILVLILKFPKYNSSCFSKPFKAPFLTDATK